MGYLFAPVSAKCLKQNQSRAFAKPDRSDNLSAIVNGWLMVVNVSKSNFHSLFICLYFVNFSAFHSIYFGLNSIRTDLWLLDFLWLILLCLATQTRARVHSRPNFAIDHWQYASKSGTDYNNGCSSTFCRSWCIPFIHRNIHQMI